MSHLRKDRRQKRQDEAAERTARNVVIDCAECGNRHAIGWSGCSPTPTPEVRALKAIFGEVIA